MPVDPETLASARAKIAEIVDRLEALALEMDDLAKLARFSAKVVRDNMETEE